MPSVSWNARRITGSACLHEGRYNHPLRSAHKDPREIDVAFHETDQAAWRLARHATKRQTWALGAQMAGHRDIPPPPPSHAALTRLHVTDSLPKLK